VREKPEQKVLSQLGELRRWKEERRGRTLLVAGCMGQRVGRELRRRAPHVDAVLGTRAFHNICEVARRAAAGERPVIDLDMTGDPSQARDCLRTAQGPADLSVFVPIIRGCSNYCAYCIVPFVRGEEVSRPLQDIVQEVEGLVARHAREVTLLGQNVLAYGKDRPQALTFADLLRRLGEVDGLWRVRFTTSHPRDVNDDLIAAMGDVPNVCEHIHLPLQTGTDRLLRAMNRGYRVGDYREKLDRLRAGIPGLSVTTDLMTGFPGETEEEFEQSLETYRTMQFDGAFMFAYSPRPGTPAEKQPDQVPPKQRLSRLNRLIAMQNAITCRKNEGELGRTVEVLVRGPAEKGDGLLAGRARNHKQVVFPGDARETGRRVRVRLDQAHLWGLTGEIVPE
jgi:tRNA-2-methylthio-N6-dimethylallyladenosine synthase